MVGPQNIADSVFSELRLYGEASGPKSGTPTTRVTNHSSTIKELPMMPRSKTVRPGLIRRRSARTKDALIEAMGLALRAVSAKDARGFFASCGYLTPAQQQ